MPCFSAADGTRISATLHVSQPLEGHSLLTLSANADASLRQAIEEFLAQFDDPQEERTSLNFGNAPLAAPTPTVPDCWSPAACCLPQLADKVHAKNAPQSSNATVADGRTSPQRRNVHVISLCGQFDALLVAAMSNKRSNNSKIGLVNRRT